MDKGTEQTCFVFQDSVNLCSPGCPATSSVDYAGRPPPEMLALASHTLD